MSKQVAVVTGCNGLIGQAICRVLQANQYKVIGLDMAEACIPDVEYRRCNLADLDNLRDVMRDIDATFGTVRLLVNNAGVWHGKSFFEITPDDYNVTFDVNTRGLFFATQFVARTMIDAGVGGAVVNIASIAGQTGSPVVDYGGAKAGVIAITKGLAKPLGAKGIRVNAIAPGIVKTAMSDRVPEEWRLRNIANTAFNRPADPVEIAKAVLFLASDASSYMTGAVVNVNGGLL